MARHLAVAPIEPQFYGAFLQQDGSRAPSAGGGRDIPHTMPGIVEQEWPALKLELAAMFKTKTRDEWCELFAGSDACVTPVLTLAEAGRASAQSGARRIHRSGRSAAKCAGAALFAHVCPILRARPRKQVPICKPCSPTGASNAWHQDMQRDVWILNYPKSISPFRDMVRKWVDKEAPKSWARELEQDEHNYPFALWDKFTEAGFHGVGIAEEFGGQGGDVVMQMILGRELARSLAGLAWIWGITSFAGSKSIGIYGIGFSEEEVSAADRRRQAACGHRVHRARRRHGRARCAAHGGGKGRRRLGA